MGTKQRSREAFANLMRDPRARHLTDRWNISIRALQRCRPFMRAARTDESFQQDYDRVLSATTQRQKARAIRTYLANLPGHVERLTKGAAGRPKSEVTNVLP